MPECVCTCFCLFCVYVLEVHNVFSNRQCVLLCTVQCMTDLGQEGGWLH